MVYTTAEITDSIWICSDFRHFEVILKLCVKTNEQQPM